MYYLKTYNKTNFSNYTWHIDKYVFLTLIPVDSKQQNQLFDFDKY